MNVRPKAFFLSVAIILIIFFIGIYIRRTYINKNAVFAIAKVFEIKNTGDSNNFKYYYYYKSKKYINSISSLDLPDQNALILIKISVDSPGMVELLDERIPDCFVDDKYLGVEWKEFPKCK